MLIDKKFVGKIKPQLAERVLRARRLRNINRVIGVASDVEPHSLQDGGVLPHQRHILFGGDNFGMFQVGLIVIDLISAVMIGVGVAGLPSTILVVQT